LFTSNLESQPLSKAHKLRALITSALKGAS